jgi:hypothetical protein
MNLLQRCSCNVTICGLCLAAVTGAYAQVSSINSAIITPRVFNDVPGAAGTYINNLGNPQNDTLSISLGEAGMSAATGYADRDIWQFANGAGAYNFQNNDYFSASFSLTLTGSGTPGIDLEAGFLFSNPSGSFGGDSQSIVKGTGEIVQFGGISFYGFSAGDSGPLPNYILGQTINMDMMYCIDPLTGNNALQYSANGVLSPYFDFALGAGIGNVAGNTLGGYFQIQNDPNNANNNGTAVFSDISISTWPVPEPSTLAFLGLGSVALLLRRRRI